MKKFTLDKETRTSVIVDTGTFEGMNIEIRCYDRDLPIAEETAKLIEFAGNLSEQYNIKAYKNLLAACVIAQDCDWNNPEDAKETLGILNRIINEAEKDCKTALS